MAAERAVWTWEVGFPTGATVYVAAPTIDAAISLAQRIVVGEVSEVTRSAKVWIDVANTTAEPLTRRT